MLRNVEKLIIMDWLYADSVQPLKHEKVHCYKSRREPLFPQYRRMIAGACVLNIPLHYSSSQSWVTSGTMHNRSLLHNKTLPHRLHRGEKLHFPKDIFRYHNFRPRHYPTTLLHCRRNFQHRCQSEESDSTQWQSHFKVDWDWLIESCRLGQTARGDSRQ